MLFGTSLEYKENVVIVGRKRQFFSNLVIPMRFTEFKCATGNISYLLQVNAQRLYNIGAAFLLLKKEAFAPIFYLVITFGLYG